MFSACYVTTPSMEVAKTLSRLLVQRRHAACVNIVPSITSVYAWQGELHEDEECLLIIKTQTRCVADIIQVVTAHHPYDCPEVIAMPLSEQGHEPYLEWLRKQTTPSSPS